MIDDIRYFGGLGDLKELKQTLPNTSRQLMDLLQDKHPKQIVLAKIGPCSRVLNSFAGWAIKPFALAVVSVLTIQQTRAARSVQLRLPWHGYGVLLPTAGLARIPALGLVFSSLFYLAFPYFGKRMIATGLKDMIFLTLSIPFRGHWMLSVATFLALAISGVSAYFSTVSPGDIAVCPTNTTTDGLLFSSEYSWLTQGDSFNDVAAVSGSIDGFTINFASIFFAANFMMTMLIMAPVWLIACCSKRCRESGIAAAYDNRHEAKKDIDKGMIATRRIAGVLLRSARKLDQGIAAGDTQPATPPASPVRTTRNPLDVPSPASTVDSPNGSVTLTLE